MDQWLQEGENNTKFYHNSVARNILGMKIQIIKRADRSQVENREEVEEELSSYFKGILTNDNNLREQEIVQITDLIPRSISREDNENLNKPIPMQEVEEALSQIAQGKASGPDGFTTNFFHFFWEMIKEEV